MPHTKTARLELRVPQNVRVRIKRAAEIEGRSVTDFVMQAADEAACRAIERDSRIQLTLEEQRRFVEALSNPPEPAPALRRAAKRYRELFGVK